MTILETYKVKTLVEQYLSGKLGVDDLIEAVVDETSTAASVGSGTDRPLGVASPDRLTLSLKKFLSKGGKFEDFVERFIPGAPQDMVARLKSTL